MRTTSLDGLRGFALLLVMINHSYVPYTHGGFIGVDIFFVLSGFLITTLLLKEYDKHNTIQFKKFYMRRVLRLAPALLIVIVSFYFYSQYFLAGDKKEDAIFPILATLFNVANFAVAYDWFPMSNLRPTWSLSIEEQFYFVWPVFLLMVLFFIKKRQHIIISVSLVVAVFWLNRILLTYNGASIDRLYHGSDTHSDGLVVGCLAALLIFWYQDESYKIFRYLQKIRIPITLIAIGFYILCTMTLGMSLRTLYVWFFPMFNIITAFFIGFLYYRGNEENTFLLSNKYLVWFGSISYGVYLWHWFFYKVYASFSFNMSNPYFLLLAYSTAIVVAAISFYFIEKPVLKLKRKFY